MAGAAWSWSAIRAGIAAAINAGVTDLRCDAHLTDKINPPACVVAPRRLVYHVTMGPGVSEIGFAVVILAAGGSERVAQVTLDRYLDPSGPHSVFAAVLADPTLGGVVDDTIIDDLDEGSYGRLAWGGVDYWGAALNGRVLASQGDST